MTTATVQQILCPICHKPNIPRARFCQHCGNDVALNNDGPRYYITRVIKEGGQGAVYETVGDDGHVYAVKEMLDRFLDPKEREEAVARFDSEARLLQRLSHPRIPRVYAHFKDEGRQYLAMDFVRGEDLEQVLEREGARPEAQVLEWADQICDVLAYLHDNGLIYRDMKPSNIMIDKVNGGIKLVDFGIAKVFQRAERGTQIGTPGYAPPEQYQGLATIESDIYALGATLHHLLTGRDPRDEPPFSFPAVRSIKPQVTQRTADAIVRALQMRPEDRFRSVAEMRAALRPVPPQQQQVRRAPATSVLPAPAQVAVPANPGTRPAQASPASARPVPGTPPAAPAAQPAGSAVAVPPQAQPRRGGIGTFISRLIRTLLVLLLITGLIGVTLALAFPSVFEQVLPGVLPGILPSATPTAPRTTLMSYVADDLVVAVPAGSDAQAIRQAFVQAFERAAREKYGAATQIHPNAPPTYIGGDPEQIGANADGTVNYRASVEGRILVAQGP